jgi:succinate dehydrogenase / fumarate reductase, membrane anchor subunit
MIVRNPGNGIDTGFFRLLDRVPPLARYTRNQGLPFIISWAHRLSGVLLVIFVWFHIYTLSFLTSVGAYAEKMKLYDLPVLTFIEWALALPVIFHALNGGRLILYESFRFRGDEVLLKWVAGLSILYAGILGVLMRMGNQEVSAAFFWLMAAAGALSAAYGLYARIWRTAHRWTWKFQRISGAFLLVMVPAHFLFMHLSPQVAKDAGQVVLRMQNLWIKLVDVALLASALYHGSYGLISILNDYAGSKEVRVVGMAAIIIAMMVAAWAGIKLIVSI